MSSPTLPFACATPDGAGSLDTLLAKRVTQCALSRVCGSCGEPLGRPIAFVGTTAEVGRNAFHFPPLHLACANALVVRAREARTGVLGQDEPGLSWSIVTTSGFEYVRPVRGGREPRATFQPNSVLG